MQSSVCPYPRRSKGGSSGCTRVRTRLNGVCQGIRGPTYDHLTHADVLHTNLAVKDADLTRTVGERLFPEDLPKDRFEVKLGSQTMLDQRPAVPKGKATSTHGEKRKSRGSGVDAMLETVDGDGRTWQLRGDEMVTVKRNQLIQRPANTQERSMADARRESVGGSNDSADGEEGADREESNDRLLPRPVLLEKHIRNDDGEEEETTTPPASASPVPREDGERVEEEAEVSEEMGETIDTATEGETTDTDTGSVCRLGPQVVEALRKMREIYMGIGGPEISRSTEESCCEECRVPKVLGSVWI
jgi:hypothetical protein